MFNVPFIIALFLLSSALINQSLANAIGTSISLKQSDLEVSSVQGANTELNDFVSDEDFGGEWQQDEDKDWDISGFVELGSGVFTQDNVVNSSTSLAELRGRFEFNYTLSEIDFTASSEVIVDEVLNEYFIEHRELFASVSLTETLDAKLGRQITTWGTGDYLFLNDLFPKDWQSFFSGRDDEYLKAPADSVRLTSYQRNFIIDFVWTPDFTPDHYINGERFSFYSPIAGQKSNIAPELFLVEKTNNDQFSARIATTKNGVEYALYGCKGFWPNPVGVHETGKYAGISYFPKLNTYGASIRAALFNGIFNIEASIYNSIEDKHGNKGNIPNDQVKLLVGYEQELGKNITGSVQYYTEHIQHYSAYIDSAYVAEQATEMNRDIVTFRLTHAGMQQKVTSSLFLFYSPSDHDGYLKSSISYRANDSWLYTMGANLFWGDKNHTFFAQHQENSNIWLRVRFNY